MRLQRTAGSVARTASRSYSVDTSKFMFLPPQETRRRGLGIVHDCLTNKGTGFDKSERERLRIRGLVPPRQLTLAMQMQKIKTMLDQLDGDIAKHQFLTGLQDRNETLFHAVLLEWIEELAPIIYTPTIGEVR